MLDIEKKIEKLFDVFIERPFNFAKHSSIGVGGNAPFACYPQTIEACCKLLDLLYTEGVPFLIVGNMTNVLPMDTGTEKIVICMRKLIRAEIGETVYVEAGVISGCLLRACRYAGKSGAEFLNGIPCTLGGALYMNAGVNGRYIAEIVDSVSVWLDGKLQTLTKDECQYAYKHSIFMERGGVILSAQLSLTNASTAEIKAIETYYAQRRRHLPTGRSMGCVFKNPEGHVAGQLIEQAGLKGMRIGGAYVSNEHANFILNDGSAKSRDICALIALIKEEIEKQFGIKLQEEIRYLT